MNYFNQALPTMKKYMFSSLFMLTFAIASGQTLLINKLKTDFISSGDRSIDQYVYDDLSSLLGIYRTSFEMDTTLIQEYRNDTLISRIYPLENKKYIYKYYPDSVVDWQIVEGDTGAPYVYYIDSENKIIGTPGGTTFNWEGENMVSEVYSDGKTNIITYHDNMENPHFKEYKYYRWKYRGSHSFIKRIDFFDGSTEELVVTEKINNYPRIVDFYKDSLHIIRYTYEYIEMPNSIETPTDPGSFVVLSVHYYNLMGQEIEKPRKGFYIERKITDKRIISTKHYLQ